MENKPLIINPKIEVKKSLIHGYGVFAKENIKPNEILEECHFMSIIMDPSEIYPPILSNLTKYYFYYISKNTSPELAWPFGNACIYNSSSTPNAYFKIDTKRRLFIFYSNKNIFKGEEIYHNYELSLNYEKNTIKTT